MRSRFFSTVLLALMIIFFRLPLSQACTFGVDGEIIRYGKEHSDLITTWEPLVKKFKELHHLKQVLSYLTDEERDYILAQFPRQNKVHGLFSSEVSNSIQINLTVDLLQSQKLNPSVFPYQSDQKGEVDPWIQTLMLSGLSIRQTIGKLEGWDFILIEAAQRFPKLKNIGIEFVSLSPRFFLLLKDFKHLESLSIDDSQLDRIPDGGLDLRIPKESLSLKKIVFSSCTGLSIKAFNHLAKRMPDLEVLGFAQISEKCSTENLKLDLSPLKSLTLLSITLEDTKNSFGKMLKTFPLGGGLNNIKQLDPFELANPNYFTENNLKALFDALSTFPALTDISPICGKNIPGWYKSSTGTDLFPLIYFALDSTYGYDFPFLGENFPILEQFLQPYLDQLWAQTFWAYTLAATRQWEAASKVALEIQRSGSLDGIKKVARIMGLYASEVHPATVEPYFEALLDQARRYENSEWARPLSIEEERALRSQWLKSLLNYPQAHGRVCPRDADVIVDELETDALKKEPNENAERDTFLLGPFARRLYRERLKDRLISETLEKLENRGGVTQRQWAEALRYQLTPRLRPLDDLRKKQVTDLSEKWWQAVMAGSSALTPSIADQALHAEVYLLLIDFFLGAQKFEKAGLWITRFIQSTAFSRCDPHSELFKKVIHSLEQFKLSDQTRKRLMDLLEPTLCHQASTPTPTDQESSLPDPLEAFARDQYGILYAPEEVERRMRNLFHISSPPSSLNPPYPPELETKEDREPPQLSGSKES